MNETPDLPVVLMERRRHRSGKPRQPVPGGTRIVSLTIAAPVVEQLDALATTLRVSRSELVETAISELVGREVA